MCGRSQDDAAETDNIALQLLRITAWLHEAFGGWAMSHEWQSNLVQNRIKPHNPSSYAQQHHDLRLVNNKRTHRQGDTHQSPVPEM